MLAVFWKAAVVAALALMISCFASSTLFTVVVTFCIVIIGHGQGLIREYFLQGGTLAEPVKKLLSALLAIVTPDLGVFDVVDNVINGESVGTSAVLAMSGAALLYLTGYAVVSHLLFVEKEL